MGTNSVAENVEVISLPEVSVIVCSYNHAKWIERCIRSLVHQENIPQADYEIILVDDASTDETSTLTPNFASLPMVRVIRNKKNLGLPSSINKALRVARGRYVVRVDSDDYVSRQFLFLLRLYLNLNREYQAVAVDYVCVDEFEKSIQKVNCIEQQIACGVMFRKECLFDIGLYNETFKMREGHELRMRFEEKFSIGRLELPLYKYRKHDRNRTADEDLVKVFDAKLGL